MLKKRLIPVLLLKDFNLVKSILFTSYQSVGNPFEEVIRFSEWEVDELVYLNIGNSNNHNFFQRQDSVLRKIENELSLISEINKNCFMPLTWGGGIKTVEEIKKILRNGADKVCLNTVAYKNYEVINEACKLFCKQAIVISIDLKKIDNQYYVFVDNGKTNTLKTIDEYIKIINDNPPGEIIIQSIDEDGRSKGFDLNIINKCLRLSNVPIIFCSGAGEYEHFVEAFKEGAQALAAANIWHYKELVDLNLKKILRDNNINVRK